MNRLLAAKEQRGLSFSELAESLGRDKVWVAALFYGQATASREEAEKLREILDLEEEVVSCIQRPPYRGRLLEEVPRDPLVYRLYEIMLVYGPAIKAVINEEFGDGIMSAIDFSIDIQKKSSPAGDRVRLVLEGKFLPYKKW
ncbi:cyanase [Thermosulfuriphilus sp.]